MTDEDLMEEFIANCTKAGFVKPAQIREKATDRIKEIDEYIEKADKLRPERLRMLNVLKALGGEAPKPKRVVPIRDEATIEDLEADAKQNAILICETIAASGPQKPRALMKVCGITVENDYKAYDVIKWLCGQGICIRDAKQDVAKGPNWVKRPVSS